ncbi:hypothetical protein [Clostridium sp.]|uniref:hypothetical protein n=1 Tax=Clostridium sp. TaxID=1506 RepID=UPI002FDE6B0E
MGRDNIIMIITLGTRDVKLDDKYFNQIEICQEYDDLKDAFYKSRDKLILSERLGGKLIYDEYDKYKDRLTFPIVEPMLNNVLNFEKQINYIYIVTTDQNDEKHRINDSIYFGYIIQKYLKNNPKIKCNDILLKQVGGNVSNLGDMNEYFKNFYNKYFKLYTENSKLYIANTGGIDAINISILINGIMKFENNCVNLYLDKEKRIAYPINFVSSFMLDFDKLKLKSLLNNYDYVSSLTIVNSHKSLKKFGVLIEIAKNRLYFNLDECKKICNKYLQEEIENNYIIKEVKANLLQIEGMDNNLSECVKELYINARIKFIQEQYVDFLLRIFRLEEAIYNCMIKNYMELPVDDNSNSNSKKLTDKILENKYMVQYFDSYNVEGSNKKLEWRNRYNIKILYTVISYIINVNKSVIGEALIEDLGVLGRFKKVFELGEMLNCLSQLRNKSIGAHGFQGVSKKKLEDTLMDKCKININKIFEIIEEVVKIQFKDSWYEKINGLIINNLK